MVKRKKLCSLTLLFCMLLVVSCGKDEMDIPIQSDRQLNEFLPGTTGFYYAPPTLVNDYIYIGTSPCGNCNIASDNAFFKLDKNLNKIWGFPLGEMEVLGAATLDNAGNIYFVIGENRTASSYYTALKLYSLSNDGAFRWSKVIWENTNPDFGWMGISSPAISVDNIIYIGGDNFYAFDINGNEVWSYVPDQSHNPILSSPIIDPSGNIFFMKNGLTSLDENGNERWVVEGFANTKSSPAFSVDYSKIFFTTLFNEIVCVNTSDGSLVWKYLIPEITGDIRGTPAIDDSNNIYIGTHGEYHEDTRQTLYAIKSDGSGLLWKNNLSSDLYSSPALGNDRVLYIGCEGYGNTGSNFDRLHAINMSTGEIIWSAQIEMDITWSSAAISDDGTLYIASMDNYSEGRKGMIYSFQTNSTGLLPNAGSPRYHGGNASTGRRD